MAILSCFAITLVQADDACRQVPLTKHEMELSITKTQATFTAMIFLPDIEDTKGEFCGFWLHQELTNNVKHQFYGYRGSNSYISLNPEISDAGLTINIENTKQWVQKGQLGKESFAGVIPVGKYSISKLKSHNE